MKNSKNVFTLTILMVIVFLFAGCGILPTPTPTPTDDEGVLTGQVMAPEDAVMAKQLTGQALANATVNIIDPDTGEVIAATTTDENGNYEVNVPEGGPYILQAEKDNIAIQQITPEVEAGKEYDLGTADETTTAVALIAQAMLEAEDFPDDLADIDLDAIENDPNFDDVLEMVQQALLDGENPAQAVEVIVEVWTFLYPDESAPPINGGGGNGGTGPEPEEYHTYKFNIEDLADQYVVVGSLTNPTDDDFKVLTPAKLSIVIDEEKDKAYEGNVRVSSVGVSELQLWAKDTSSNWWDINEVGWGPAGGFQIDTDAVTDVYVIATAEIDTDITLELIDIDEDYGAVDGIIISQDEHIKAINDVTNPELVYVSPEPGIMVLEENSSFVWKVKAYDEGGLEKLEIDHSLESTLPEFNVYANPDNPYGSPDAKAQFESNGVEVTYDESEQEWTIDFGETITNDHFIENEGITFYLVLHDLAGNTWCTMDGTTSENTFAYKLYNSIQDAILAAVDGDTILVGSGTFDEANLHIDTNNLTLTSANGAEETIINATGTTRNAILIEATGVTIDGFTVKNWGQVGTEGGTSNRRAIVAGSGASNVTISNNTVKYNIEQDRQANGIVSEINNGEVIISGNTVLGITYTHGGDTLEEWSGTGIAVWGADNVEINGNDIQGTQLSIGLYGFQTIETADVDILNNTINDSGQAHIHLNHEWGAGIDESNITISNNTFGSVNDYYLEVQNRPNEDVAINYESFIDNNNFNSAEVERDGDNVVEKIEQNS